MHGKSHYSDSTDPLLIAALTRHDLLVGEIRLSVCAEFVMVIRGDIMIVPGLPRVPSANSIHLNETGDIEGLCGILLQRDYAADPPGQRID